MDLTNKLAIAFAAEFPKEAGIELGSRSSPEAAAALEALPKDSAVALLFHMNLAAAANALRQLSPGSIGPIFASLPPSHAGAILRLLVPEEQKRLLSELPENDADRIRKLARFQPGTAGALMEPVVLALAPETTVQVALRNLRRLPSNHQPIFVVDSEHRLTGIVDLPGLVRAKESATLESIQLEVSHYFEPAAHLRFIADHPGWGETDFIPVVDRKDRLLGVLTPRAVYQARTKQSIDGQVDSTTVTALGDLIRVGVGGMFDALAPQPNSPRPNREPENTGRSVRR